MIYFPNLGVTYDSGVHLLQFFFLLLPEHIETRIEHSNCVHEH